MSRVGNAVISVPKGVTVQNQGRKVSVKGPNGELHYEMPKNVALKIDGAVVTFARENEQRATRALHGTARARVANMVTGVSTGFRREIEIVGVGYRAAVKGDAVDLTLGFSHPVSYALPKGIKAEATKDGKLILTGADKALLGQVAADIRSYRPPEPYKGKGLRYSDETIIRKEGKRGKK